MSKYSKAIIALIAVVLTGLNAIYGNNSNIQLLISVATAAGVYQVRNK